PLEACRALLPDRRGAAPPSGWPRPRPSHCKERGPGSWFRAEDSSLQARRARGGAARPKQSDNRGGEEIPMTQANEPHRDGRLYLEDLKVGQRFRSTSHALDEAQIKAFAAQFDPQPFHLDDETAKGTLFAGLAASGWHTAAITMKLIIEGAPIAGGI